MAYDSQLGDALKTIERHKETIEHLGRRLAAKDAEIKQIVIRCAQTAKEHFAGSQIDGEGVSNAIKAAHL